MNQETLALFKKLTQEIIALETAALLLSKDKDETGDLCCGNASSDRLDKLAVLIEQMMGHSVSERGLNSAE